MCFAYFRVLNLGKNRGEREREARRCSGEVTPNVANIDVLALVIKAIGKSNLPIKEMTLK